ncbi:MAG: hypothetical protein KC656_33645, partial [Myxococcales bacterium]|nr:hypothetical protein [Myxococcales bacterium]
ELVRQVFANNRAWVSEMEARDPGFFERLAAEQKPEFLYIGCADSRDACVRTGLDDQGDDVFTCRPPCTTVGADQACQRDEACLVVPSEALELQPAGPTDCDQTPCGSGFVCQDVEEAGGVRRACARDVLACVAPASPFDFSDDQATQEGTYCDLGVGGSDHGWCGAPDGASTTARPRCEAVVPGASDTGRCVVYCGADEIGTRADASCGTGHGCIVPEDPWLYLPVDPVVSCASSPDACDEDQSCLDFGGGKVCAVALKVCQPLVPQ